MLFPTRKILKEDREKIQEAILYILNKRSDLTQYQIVKSLFLADRSHLNRYGRPITFDNYVAMEHGPVPSVAYDALKPSHPYKMTFGVERPWTSVPDSANPKTNRYTAARAPRLEYLSKSDIEALDEALGTVLSLSFPQLRKLTHEDPAYVEAWERRGGSLSSDMSLPLLIENDGEERAEELAYISAHG